MIYGATVTLSDPQAPVAGALTGTLFAGGWVRGSRTAAMTGADATGVHSLDLTRDGGTSVRTNPFTCDYRLPAPCTVSGSTSASSSWSDVDTSSLSDGTHTFVGVAEDAAGNTQPSASVDVQVDNTPSVPPVGLTAGDLWTSQAARTVSWSLPGEQAAPLNAAEVTVCKEGGSCFTPSASAMTSSFALPSEGTWVASVRLIDAAGNVGAAGTVPVGLDTGTPPAPTLGAVTPTGGSTYQLAVATNDPGPAPIAELVGEACPADGGSCQTISSAGGPTDGVSFALPSPGRWAIAIRSRDAANNVGPSATATHTVAPAQETATPTPAVTVAPSPTPTPVTVAPSPTPTATPAATRRTSRLLLTRTRLTRRELVLRGVVSKAASGRVVVTLAARKRLLKRTVKVKAGGFSVRLRLKGTQRGVRRARVTLAYAGDAHYRPRKKTVTIKRRGI